MIICPVCEHQQAAGFECDVCGKDLGAALGDGALLAPLAPDVPRMPELEQTGVELAANVPVTPMPELEAHQSAAGTPNVPTPLIPDLETTQPSTGDVPVVPMPELSLDRAEFVGQKAVAPTGQVQCRYCGNLQPTGKICDKCGMRLPRAGTVAGLSKLATDLVRCKECGSMGHLGERCKECGRIVVAKEA
jgi:ribosomal protein L32